MKISLYEYNLLPEDEKSQMIWDHGTFITNKADDFKAVNLFSLSSFYVEIWYDRVNNKITQIRSFNSFKQLSPNFHDMVVVLS